MSRECDVNTPAGFCFEIVYHMCIYLFDTILYRRAPGTARARGVSDSAFTHIPHMHAHTHTTLKSKRCNANRIGIQRGALLRFRFFFCHYFYNCEDLSLKYALSVFRRNGQRGKSNYFKGFSTEISPRALARWMRVDVYDRATVKYTTLRTKSQPAMGSSRRVVRARRRRPCALP